MALVYDLTTEDGLRAYLTARGWTNDIEIDQLSGGTANYVFRVKCPFDLSANIFKHAAPYLSSSKTFAFDPLRMDYEARMLGILAPAEGRSLLSKHLSSSNVHAVQLRSYDKQQKLICIEDGGSQHLKDAYTQLKPKMSKIGDELGKWLALLHMTTRETSLADPDETTSGLLSRNNPIGVNIYRHCYNNLHTAFTKYGHDPKLAHTINEEYGALLSVDDECVCHGDFWPGNVLIKQDISKEGPVELTIVDWEMTRRGTSATDVAQFTAEAFLLHRFKGETDLLPNFLEAYAKAREGDAYLNKKWMGRLVVHWAIHVAYWPTRVQWTTEEGTRELVDLGAGMLQDVLDDNWERLLGSPVLRHVRDTYAPFLERS